LANHNGGCGSQSSVPSTIDGPSSVNQEKNPNRKRGRGRPPLDREKEEAKRVKIVAHMMRLREIRNGREPSPVYSQTHHQDIFATPMRAENSQGPGPETQELMTQPPRLRPSSTLLLCSAPFDLRREEEGPIRRRMTSASPSGRKGIGGKKRGKLRWTYEESYFIWKGVQVYGEGQWGKILDAYELKFHQSRTNISIKDRWRTMLKRGVDQQMADDYKNQQKGFEDPFHIDVIDIDDDDTDALTD
jgi:hypothetical protein